MTISKPVLNGLTVAFGVIAVFLVIDAVLALSLHAGVSGLSAAQLTWRIVPTVLAIALFAGCLVLRRLTGRSSRRPGSARRR